MLILLATVAILMGSVSGLIILLAGGCVLWHIVTTLYEGGYNGMMVLLTAGVIFFISLSVLLLLYLHGIHHA